MTRILGKSIKTRLIVIFTACAIAPFLVQSLVVNELYSRKLESKLNEASILGLEKLSWEVGSNIQKLFGMSATFTSNNELKAELARSGRGPAAEAELGESVTGLISGNLRDSDVHIHVLIVSREGRSYSERQLGEAQSRGIASRVFEEDWYRKSFKNQPGAIWLGVRDSYGPLESRRDFYLARHLVHEGEYVGTVLVGFDDYTLYRLFDDVRISADSRIFMLDKSGRALLRDQADGDDPRLPDEAFASPPRDPATDHGYRIVKEGNRSYLVSFCAMPEYDWELVSVTPEASVLSELKGIRAIPIALLFLMLASLFLFVLILNGEIFAPVLKLRDSLKEVRMGNLDISIELPHDDEIGELAKGFNGMTADLKLYIRRIQEEEEQKRRLEVEALEAQIRPHFIYNTLNSIKWMAEMQGAKSISDAIVAMVSLIEYNAGDRGVLARVADEIEALGSYVYLQQLRYWNSFETAFAVPEDCRELAIPRLSLQPIVENAVSHGLAGLSRPGRLELSAALEAGGLRFRIADNGVGMDSARLEEVMRSRSEDEGPRLGGVGIRNVRQRIKLRFGEPYGLSIASEPGVGTVVDLLFPVLRGAAAEGAAE
jgi:two-component system, sensor histidine kinase YesM